MPEEQINYNFAIFIGSFVLIILVLALFISIGKFKTMLTNTEKKFDSNLNLLVVKMFTQNQYSKNFHKFGLQAFSDKDVLEFLLSLHSPEIDISTVSKTLIDKYKTLRNVIDSVISGEVNLLGIKSKNLFILRLIKEVSERYLNQGLTDRSYAGNAKSIFDYLYHSMRGMDKEVFKIISLDAENQIIDIHDASVGTVDTATIHVREIIKHLILKNAQSVVFVHNHLSGNINPSKSDKEITTLLLKACDLMEIPMHDHIIIGDNKYYSFAESGFI